MEKPLFSVMRRIMRGAMHISWIIIKQHLWGSLKSEKLLFKILAQATWWAKGEKQKGNAQGENTASDL